MLLKVGGEAPYAKPSAAGGDEQEAGASKWKFAPPSLHPLLPKLVFHSPAIYPCVIGGSGDIAGFTLAKKDSPTCKASILLVPGQRAAPGQLNAGGNMAAWWSIAVKGRSHLPRSVCVFVNQGFEKSFSESHNCFSFVTFGEFWCNLKNTPVFSSKGEYLKLCTKRSLALNGYLGEAAPVCQSEGWTDTQKI